MAERTLVLIKPDAVERRLAGRILDRFEQRGLTIRGSQARPRGPGAGGAPLRRAPEKPFFGELVDFITSSPTLALVLEGEAAIAVVRTTMGATNPASAAPGTIRGDLALSMPDNLVHGSDSPNRLRARSRCGSSRPSLSDLSEHVRRNRESWDAGRAELGRVRAGAPGRATSRTGGCGGFPRASCGSLPDVDGKDVIELGCGTAYWSAWLARRGARPVGIDNSERQLETARSLQREHGLEFPLVHGERRGGSVPRRELRPRLLRVRRVHLVRSVPVDP